MVNSELGYSKDHEWVRVEGNEAYVGITEYAQTQLGDIVYVELPEVDTEIKRDEVVCGVESVKTASDVVSPVSGKVLAVNEELDDEPELINENAYKAWIMHVELSDSAELDDLMNESEYSSYCENED